MQRVLAFFYERHDDFATPWLNRAAEDVLGMVAAEATDIQIAGYLKSVAHSQGIAFPPKARLTSIALWHIAKAALVRDAATALLNSDLGSQPQQPPPLSDWLASRLLSPAELARFEVEGRALPED
ncbi:MAG: hypothetical protein NUV34_01670 [Sulfuricaulis sp.]|nr:hypothetical protein [Sulfuricaulis sp.]